MNDGPMESYVAMVTTNWFILLTHVGLWVNDIPAENCHDYPHDHFLPLFAYCIHFLTA